MITDDRLKSGWKPQYDMLKKQKGNVWKGQVDRIGSPGNVTWDLQDTAHLMYGTKLVTEAICSTMHERLAHLESWPARGSHGRCDRGP